MSFEATQGLDQEGWLMRVGQTKEKTEDPSDSQEGNSEKEASCSKTRVIIKYRVGKEKRG